MCVKRYVLPFLGTKSVPQDSVEDESYNFNTLFLLSSRLFGPQFLTTCATSRPSFTSVYKTVARGNSESKTHRNRAEMTKIHHTNTDKVSRRQGKVFLFNSCSLFWTPKHVCKTHKNPYNFHHCVTFIVTLK